MVTESDKGKDLSQATAELFAELIPYLQFRTVPAGSRFHLYERGNFIVISFAKAGLKPFITTNLC